MKIIKIVDDHITNSSSAGAVIIIAVKKGKDLKKLFKQAGIPEASTSYFAEDKRNLEDYVKKFSHLNHDYNFLGADITFSEYGDENAEYPEDEKAYHKIDSNIGKISKNNLRILYTEIYP